MDSKVDQTSSHRPMFGNRLLTDEGEVFKHNAWDNVEWTEEQENEAKAITAQQAKKILSKNEQSIFLMQAASFWNKFYDKHDNKFFKDRHWLFTEFPELSHTPSTEDNVDELSTTMSKSTIKSTNANSMTDNNIDFSHASSGFPGCEAEVRVLEVGCGVGNTIFPVLQVNKDKQFYMYGCDYSESAVDIIKSHKNYDAERCHVFVYDISTDTEKMPFPIESVDIIVMIFVLSALEFSKMQNAVAQIVKYLKPGGKILFRDYGRYDMAQLRFKEGRCLAENFYARGDGTLVYFFTQSEVRNIFTSAGLIEMQNLVDRRLQVNRARQIKMYRVWVQAKYKKPI